MPDDQQTPNPGEPNNVCRLRPVTIRQCQPATQRKQCALDYRRTEAGRACTRDPEPLKNRNNGEETTLVDPITGKRIFAANYTKGMPHDAIGEVDPAAYEDLLVAVKTEDPADFEKIPTGFTPEPDGPGRRFVDPQAASAYDVEGPDGQSAAVYLPDLQIRRILEAPRFPDAWLAADIGEIYLMALLRDVPLLEFSGTTSSHPLVQEAVRLMRLFSDYRGPLDPQTGEITPQALFRGGNVYSVPGGSTDHVGELVGPPISQYLIIGTRLDDPGGFPPQFAGGGGTSRERAAGIGLRREDGILLYGTVSIDQRHFEVQNNLDFMTDADTVLEILRGREPREQSQFTGKRRFLYNLRQMAEYVGRDQTYQEGLIACLNIISMFERADRTGQTLFGPGNPYLPAKSRNQMGFGTFGNGHILALLAEATTRALKATWHQKWYNHRRLRPETLGLRIHNVLSGNVDPRRYDINREIASFTEQPGKDIMMMTFERNLRQNEAQGRPEGGAYVLSQQYTEGSPTHPSYPAGHATQIAAEVTVMKGFWNENFIITDEEDPVLIPNSDGTSLIPYQGPGGPSLQLRLGEELNKLAANVALARSFAGVHYRLDYAESMLLGEYIGLGVLQEQARSFNPEHFFEVTLFSGTRVRVRSDGRIEEV